MFKLPKYVSKKYNEARASEAERKAVFAGLSDTDLAASAKFWMQHCNAPKRFSADELIYDATFWHVIVPELLRRMERR